MIATAETTALWGADAKASELATAAASSFTAVGTLATAETTTLWGADPNASELVTAAAGPFTAKSTIATAAAVAAAFAAT